MEAVNLKSSFDFSLSISQELPALHLLSHNVPLCGVMSPKGFQVLFVSTTEQQWEPFHLNTARSTHWTQ